MRLAIVVSAAALGTGCLMVAADLFVGPSLSLLSANSTGLIALATLLIVAIAFIGRRDYAPSQDAPAYRVRKPDREMRALVQGAMEGYVSNRRGVVRILSGAAKARLDDGSRAHLDGEAEELLRRALGSAYEELAAPQTVYSSRVEPSPAYARRLLEAVSALERSLVS